MSSDYKEQTDLQKKLGEMIENPVFNGIIHFFILVSAVVFVLENEAGLKKYKIYFDTINRTFLVLFTIEYILRIYTAPIKKKYIFSFLGIIDFLAILPSMVLIPEFRMFRVFRVLRIFRIFKAAQFILAVDGIFEALSVVKRQLLGVVVLSSLLVYLAACGIHFFERVEQPEKFGSVINSMWWAIVTLTTIGYGDAVPITPGGRIFTALIAVVGIGLIAIPSGLLASVLTEVRIEEAHRDEKQDTNDV